MMAFLATDSGFCVVLVMLDLTAAFDTVDHQILLSRLESWVGIQGGALEWFRLPFRNLFLLHLYATDARK